MFINLMILSKPIHPLERSSFSIIFLLDQTISYFFMRFCTISSHCRVKIGWQFLSLSLTTAYVTVTYAEHCYPSQIVWVIVSLLHLAQFLWLVTVKQNAGYLDAENNSQSVVGQSAHAMPPHYCKTCKMYQPRRAKHCHQTGYCVLTFDHYCHWIGGCVGEFNHKRFFGFLYLF